MSDAAPSARPAAWVAGYWRDQSSFVAACGAAVAAGRSPHAVTPWPVHGLDRVLGIPRSLLGRPVLTVIFLGFALGLWLCWFTMSQDWPLNVGGKPYFAWPTFVVVIMETGLLFGALANLGLGFHSARLLPHPDTRLINDRLTDDTFALVLPTRGEAADAVVAWLLAHGAQEAAALPVAQPAAAEEPTHA
jgi:hypothetical protein